MRLMRKFQKPHHRRFRDSVWISGIASALLLASCGGQTSQSEVGVSVSVVTHEQATGNTGSVDLNSLASHHTPSCQVRPVGDQKELLVTVLATSAPEASVQDQLDITVASYHGDGVYSVPDAEGATQVSLFMTGSALSSAQQLQLDPTLGFQVGGTITVAASGKVISFSGGNSVRMSLPSNGTIAGKGCLLR